MVDVRAVQESDLEGCLDSFSMAYSQQPWNEHWPRELAEIHLTELMGYPSFLGLVATGDTTIYGAIFGHYQQWSDGIEYMLDEIWVDPDNQAKGIGTDLLTALKQRVRDAGAHGITLWTLRAAPATGFYLKHEFIEVPERAIYRLIF